ncbi:MAG: hydantoinase/oxoprolinase family protein, partial [Candidatus Adiutrix sp.]|nr:hydantoinase/oxoprolinase family protein [Candidatus Adiutrix sp.]
MYLGIDVGGTHTDGVRLGEDFTVAAAAKVPTLAGDVLGSVRAALEPLLRGAGPGRVRRLAVSGTLGLNAILTGQADRVGALATGGPGLPPTCPEPLFRIISGSQDHRGEVLRALTPGEAEAAVRSLAADGAEAFAVISKFGPKNSALENALAEAVAGAAPGAPLTAASRLAGRLNFPRRLNTAVYNSAVKRLYRRFLDDLRQAAAEAGLTCPLRLLTADGGALSPEEAAESPVLALAAGPAAGLLGLWALAGLDGDALMVDIGGTSTDLGLLADGEPLLTAEGLEINGRPTLVRAFLTTSVPLGGDLILTADGGRVRILPERRGPALALCPADLGQRPPTLTDALNVLNLAAVGDPELSRQALAALGAGRPEDAARQALGEVRRTLQEALARLLGLVNNRPVYTVNALRLAREVRPTRAAILGGPAPALAGTVAEALGLPVSVPPEAAVANAVGAARSRP